MTNKNTRITRKKQSNNLTPIIKGFEKVVVFEKNGNKPVFTANITKTIDGEKSTIKGKINGKPIKKTLKKVRFPPDLISPRKGAFTSKKNSYPKSILKK